MWVHFGMAECGVPFLGHCDLDLVFRKNCVWDISLILFEVGIPNLVCKCILGCRSVQFHFRVAVTLTSDLVSRISIIESGAYLYISYII